MSANGLKLNADKTDLIWTGTRHGVACLSDGGPALTLGDDTVDGASAVRVLGVTITPDLMLDRHVSTVSAKCFFQLRQLRRVRRSLDVESTKTLVHAFVTSRVDYCSVLLAKAPKTWTNKLQRVMNAAARVITNTRKYDRGLTRILHDDLHWLDVTKRIDFRLCVTVYKCLRGLAPPYLTQLCMPVSGIPARSCLRSATSGMLDKPDLKLSTYGRRAFSYAGPTAWNALPVSLRTSTATIDTFKRHLKTHFFDEQTEHRAH
jgi:hypothetical protein